ncbi:TonB-dependent siderophore receptor [Alcanivorax sp. 24]|uniref:TonB-dependent siderophore receptor n=1 Tax=Alcanivorax sp. 24 TaxID=2545266 RepID=UPI00105DA6E9|nr:TonB-dependent siderophore receptor [Alcanivorax sp. 24]
MRLNPLRAALFGAVILTCAAQAAPLNLPAQSLDQALLDLADATGVTLIYDTVLTQDKQSPALRGNYSATAALDQLLAGSGLRYRRNDDGSYTLEAAPAQSSRAHSPARPNVLAPVAVTAQAATKIDQPTLETPQSISVVRREQIESQGSETVQQALRYTPGVFTDQIGASKRYDYVVMRGFSDDSIDNIYLDGLKTMGDPGTFNSIQVDPYFLERVGVVKGPSSVLYGRASPGGLVNLTSKQPLFETRQEIQFRAGSNDTLGAAFDFAGPLGDRAAYRIIGLTEGGDTQFDHVEQKRHAIAPSFTIDLSDRTTLDLMAYYQDDPEGGSHSGLPAEGTLYRHNGLYVSRHFFEGEPDYEQYERTQKMIGYRLEHVINDTFRFRQNYRYLESDVQLQQVYAYGWVGDTNELNRYFSGADEHLSAHAVDTQLQADFDKWGLRHTLLLGFDYQHRDVDALWLNGAFPPIDAFDPVYGSAPLAPFTASDNDRKLIQTGVYLQDTMSLDNWRFSLGGRQDWVRTANVDVASGARSSQNRSRFSGRAGVLYLFDNGLAPYVSYSESFNPSVYTDEDGNPLKPTEGTQYETGVKYQPRDGRGIYTLSLFHIDQENVAIREPQAAIYLPIGQIRSRGVELEAQTMVTDQLALQASYTYTDIRYQDAEQDIEGNRVNQAPRHQAALWGQYRFNDGALESLDVGLGARVVTDIVADRANTRTVPSYTLFDASLGYDLGRIGLRGMDLRVNVNNLTDKEYVASCYSLDYCYMGAERSVMATLTYRLR